MSACGKSVRNGRRQGDVHVRAPIVIGTMHPGNQSHPSQLCGILFGSLLAIVILKEAMTGWWALASAFVLLLCRRLSHQVRRCSNSGRCSSGHFWFARQKFLGGGLVC
jgi:hypothetical protein